LKNKDALIYLDDILIPPKTISEGMEKLQRVLTALTGPDFRSILKNVDFLKQKFKRFPKTV
jgi:hypothetical protein